LGWLKSGDRVPLSDYLSGEYGSYANYGGFGYGGYGSPYKEYGDSIDDEIQKTAERFLDHLKDESGLSEN
jgi:hypothetical protein